MQRYLIEMLECPACHGELSWEVIDASQERIKEAEARCKSCQAAYPVHDEIAVFLTPDLQRNDLWEQSESQLAQYLGAHPESERALMEAPLESLAPADQFFRAMALEERGDFAGARRAERAAYQGLYTPDFLACMESQMDFVMQQLAGTEESVVDLASGRGYLVERLAQAFGRPVVATDFSPLVLKRDRPRLEYLGVYDRVSLLAFDARRTPFKDGAVKNLTSHMGLANIEKPGELLKELKRVVDGAFLSISHFYPEEDRRNREAIQQFTLEAFLYRRSASDHFAEAGWKVEFKNICRGKAKPTPVGVILEGAGVDGLPVAETTLEWCVAVATNG